MLKPTSKIAHGQKKENYSKQPLNSNKNSCKWVRLYDAYKIPGIEYLFLPNLCVEVI